MAALPAQIQQHEPNKFHIKLWRKKEGEDTVVSFALGRKALESLMTCSGSTGGPKGIFDKTAWDCAGKEPEACKVIARGTYLKGLDIPGDFKKTENNPYEIDFNTGSGFDGGKMIFSIRRGAAMESPWEAQYAITPLECNGMDVSKLPGETTAKATRAKRQAGPGTKQVKLTPEEKKPAPAKAKPKKQPPEERQKKVALVAGRPGCTVWSKDDRWKYYYDPRVAGQIWQYLDDRCGGAPTCHVESELISTTAKKWLSHRVVGDVKDVKGTPVERMEQLHGVNSGIADLFLRLSANPAVKMLDVDVHVPKDIARDVAKSIDAYLKKRDLHPRPIFTGKTGYHVEYNDGIEDLRQSEALVDDVVASVQKKFPDITITKAVEHPPENSVAVDWSRCSSATGARGTTCLVPFSLRFDSCLASVPVDFKKLPKFDPDVHAKPEYVLEHFDKFT